MSPMLDVLASAPSALTCRGLHKRFRTEVALADVDLDVPEGAVYLLVGNNGAGKSTLLGIALDLIRASAGSCEIFGTSSRSAAARAVIGHVPDGARRGYAWMRTGQLLAHHAHYYPNWDRDYARTLTDALEVDPRRRVGALSEGQARRLHLVTALAHRPRLLLLDEPTAGVDPLMRDVFHGLLADHLATTATTALITTHHVQEVERLADCLGVLRAGRMVAQQRCEALAQNLRGYRATVPESFPTAEHLGLTALTERTSPPRIDWTIWGEATAVRHALERAGAAAIDEYPLALEQAANALLSYRPEAL